MKEYACDLVKSLREKNIPQVTYLAHSVNAFIAFHAAIKEPALFDKIVLLSALPYLRQDMNAQYQCGFDADTDTNFFFDKIFKSQPLDDTSPEQLQTLLARSFSKMNEDKARLILNLLMTTDCRSHLDNITIPVMILQGLHDKIANSEAAFFMHRRIPDSFIVKIKAKGHLPQYSAPEELVRVMEIFLYPAFC